MGFSLSCTEQVDDLLLCNLRRLLREELDFDFGSLAIAKFRSVHYVNIPDFPLIGNFAHGSNRGHQCSHVESLRLLETFAVCDRQWWIRGKLCNVIRRNRHQWIKLGFFEVNEDFLWRVKVLLLNVGFERDIRHSKAQIIFELHVSFLQRFRVVAFLA